MQVLESYYSGPKIGLRVLVSKSLVIISENNEIEMHDLIQDMGKCIVQMQKHPGEYSRLWNVKDFKEVIDNNMGTMAVEAIWFTYFEELSFNKEAMKSMKMLRILCIRNRYEKNKTTSSDSNCHDGSIEYLSNNLRWFVWHDYPWQLLPENFNPKGLVHVDLRWSSLHYLWNETKHQLRSLRFLDLRGSKNLKRTPDFKAMPNLEYLDLSECRSLEEVQNSLECCIKLIKLNLNNCVSLKRFPSVNVESLRSLNLGYCYCLEKFPEILGIMKPELQITMSYSGIRELPLSIIHPQAHLTDLHLLGLKNLVSLPSSIYGGLPEDIGSLSSLEELKLFGNNFEHLPQSISELGALRLLNLSDCKRLTQLPEFPQQLDTIHADWSNDSICNSLFQNISSLQHDICTSDSLSLRVFTTGEDNIPRWFHHLEDGTSIFVKLPKNWYCKLGSRYSKNNIGNSAYEGHMFLLFVTEQLESWPEKEICERTWMSIGTISKPSHVSKLTEQRALFPGIKFHWSRS
uniref:Bacterial spot disease resistance protein 4 n=1 Tax=Solanum tuberosum TaxID=4113 RepID=M1D405_SOLTU